VGGEVTTKGKQKVATNRKSDGRAVIVTTEHRGVFFGYATDTNGDQIELKRARLCVYWSAAMRGFMGLASVGPDQDCKIGPPADITLRKITSVIEVTPQAVDRWEGAKWKS
jgi:hypothetical protein